MVLEPVELASDGLVLRPWRDSDLPVLERGLRDPEYRRFSGAHAPTPDAAGARGYLDARRAGWRNGNAASFAVTDPDTGAVLGHIGLGGIDAVHRGGRLGYWVLPPARGRGVASRSVRLVTRWAFADVGLHRLELGHAVANRASCKVAENAGYPLEGTLREAMLDSAGVPRDIHLHARLATD